MLMARFPGLPRQTLIAVGIVGLAIYAKTQSLRILRPLTDERTRYFALFPAEMTTPPGYPTGTRGKSGLYLYPNNNLLAVK